MPEEKATLSKQPAPEKKPDAAKLPNAPPKTEKPPDKNDGIKPASAAEPQKPEDKSGTLPPAEVKKADASGKDSRKDTVPTSDVKKPEASVKSPPAPAEAKKPATPANTPWQDWRQGYRSCEQRRKARRGSQAAHKSRRRENADTE